MGRDKHNDACTGPDFYFEKALQSPSLPSYSFSFPRSSGQSNQKFVLLPSSMRSKHDGGQYSSPARTTLSYHARQHEFRDPPTHSPGSNSTSKTSLCTDDDYDDENDVNSHCGSLTYSVESWIESYPHDEVDDDETDVGYHAEDEDTICTNDIGRSGYNHENMEDDCFGVDLCFQPLDAVSAWVKETFLTLGGIQEDETGKQSRLGLVDRFETVGPA